MQSGTYNNTLDRYFKNLNRSHEIKRLKRSIMILLLFATCRMQCEDLDQILNKYTTQDEI